MDNVGIVVEDLDAAIAFFAELGLVLEARMPIEGEWGGRVTGVRGQRVEIAMMRTPDGHGRLELSRFDAPAIASDHRTAPVNSLGYLRVMFAVENLDDTLARLAQARAPGNGMTPDIEQIYQSIGAKLLSIGEDGVMSADVFYPLARRAEADLSVRRRALLCSARDGKFELTLTYPDDFDDSRDEAERRLSESVFRRYLRERGLSPESILPEELLSPGFAFFEEQRAEDALPVTEEEMGDAFKAFAFGHPAFMAVRGRRPQTVEFRFGSV